MQFLASMPSAEDLLRSLCGWLCQFFYSIIAWLYELFMNISRVEILTSDKIQPIYQRITMILSIIMIFYVTFEAVKYVIQPEQFSDKEKGASKLVIKMVLVVVLIAFVPQIFGWAYKLQNTIFDNQLFSKIILGKQTIDTNKFGRVFSANILGMFYYADEETWTTSELDDCDGVPCKNIVNMNLNSLVEYGELPLIGTGLNAKGTKNDQGTKGVERYYIHFNGILAILVGGFITYMLILYCADAGLRVAQLAFLQIIAPIPIIGYLGPKKEGIFEKWTKQCLITYVDLFLRVGIIYFVLLVCQILSDAYNDGTLFNNIVGDGTPLMKTFIYIALVIGLLMFAKKAPKMLGELFPNSGAASGNFGLNLKDRPAIARGAGMAIGAGVVGAKGLISAATNKAKRDFRNIKSGKHQENLNNQRSAFTNRLERNRELASARLNYMKNRANMSKEERKMAREEINQAKQNLRDAKIEQKSANAAARNTAIGTGVAGAAVAGAIGGVIRGTKAGVQATDLKGIGKQVAKGWKDESSALAKTEKWYNEGGGSQVSRVVTSIEKGLGITTNSELLADEIKREDEKIKNNDTLISIESDVKKRSDEVESRLESKLDTDLKIKAEESTDYLNQQFNKAFPGSRVDIRDGDTLRDLRKRYKTKTETAQAELDRAVKENKSREEIIKAENALAHARKEEDLVKKHTMRAAYTQMLQNPSSKESDGVTLQKINSMKESVNTARRSKETVNKFTELLNEEIRQGTITEEDAKHQLAAFIGTEDFTNYDQLDGVITRLQTIVSGRNIENQRIKETKRKLESSSANAAAKADNNASSSGH